MASGDNACYEQTTTVDPLSHQHLTASDAGGRQAYDLHYSGTSPYTLYSTTKYKYDANGNLITITHPDGASTTNFTFDATGHKTALFRR